MDPQSTFNELYKHIDGYTASVKARKNLSYFYFGHTYGEITFEGFKKILETLKVHDEDIFYDLGCGTGKAVLLATLLTDVKKSVGVEIFPEVFEEAVKVLDHYRKVLPALPEHKKSQKIEFINSDMNAVDISEATLVFMNATCFGYEITPELSERLSLLKKGSKVVTTTFSYANPSYTIIQEMSLPFSWGNEMVYFHEKIS